jgi:hypothetical protein
LTRLAETERSLTAARAEAASLRDELADTRRGLVDSSAEVLSEKACSRAEVMTVLTAVQRRLSEDEREALQRAILAEQERDSQRVRPLSTPARAHRSPTTAAL